MAQVDRDNLRALVQASGRSARAISLDAKLGATAIKDILSGKSRDPGASTLAAIADQLGVEVADLMDDPPSREGPLLTQVKLAPLELQVRYRVKAGRWFELETDEPPEQVELPVVPKPRYSAFPQWLEKVEGDSVNLAIPDGGYAHVVDALEMGYSAKEGDFVVVERRRDQGAVRERTIKQVHIEDDGTVTLRPCSSNPKWADPVVMTEGCRADEDVEAIIVGKVVGAYHSL